MQSPRVKIPITTALVLGITATLFTTCLLSSFTTVQVVVQFQNPRTKLLGNGPETVESSLNQFAGGDRINEEIISNKKLGRKKKRMKEEDYTILAETHAVPAQSSSTALVEAPRPPALADVEVSTEVYRPRLDMEGVNTSVTFPTYVSDPNPDQIFPRIAWLLSFPNSGTSYSIHVVRKLTQLCTGTNYIHESKDSHPVNIYPTSPNGPYWIDLKRFPEIPEDSYVLTKTHCDGFCNAAGKCKVQKYMVDVDTFQLGCLGQKEGKNSTKNTAYSPTLVSRAIHLVRDPLDNIVSRFHLSHKKFTTEEKSNITRDAIGFQAFCAEMDLIQQKSDQAGIQTLFTRHNINATDIIDVPCWTDFYRYVSWHNNAMSVKANLHLPSLKVYYEDFDGDEKWNSTVTGMLTFLKLSPSSKGKIHKFKPGKSYHDYYSSDQRKAVWKLIAKLSFVDTWDLVKRYSIS